MSIDNLVIVESPAKAKTIEKFLGSNYSVKSSFGHIRDLPKKGLNIDLDNNFEPLYEIPEDKLKVVEELKKAANSSKTVWLASDEDREGEAIAWHLTKALKLPKDKTKRIVFHEITKEAINNAIENPRRVNHNIVNAQQARRVLDRLVGYELSPILWKKVQPGLSAGRVQSIAVKLIVDREREIKTFESSDNYKVIANFDSHKNQFTAELNKRLEDEKSVKGFLSDCIKSEFKVIDVSSKPSQRNPGAPFTTSTLQQEAARKLGFSVKQTMTLAQRLYENGHITYMRTDSTNVSGLAIKACEEYIMNHFGTRYYHRRQFKAKSIGAQEAHEAIRPTSVSVEKAGENSAQIKLYHLIWKRMMASQMAPAETVKSEIDISISKRPELFIAKGEVLTFDGFYKVLGGSKEDSILPKMTIGNTLKLELITATQTYSKPPARFSEASLVKMLEELGIGRPSTYAPIINTIQSRGYIEKTDLLGDERPVNEITLKNGKIAKLEKQEKFGSDKNKLLPTHLAEVTTDFLDKYFKIIMDSGFTAKAETQLDEISEGDLVWQSVIKDFYDKFHPLLDKAMKVSRQEASQARLLGHDPKSNKPIYSRFGRYGPMLQRGEVEGQEEKPDFAPMPAGTTIEDVTLEQALKMFSLPRRVGKTEDGQEIIANIGRFGPYIKIGSQFVSIKPLDPFSIDQQKAIELYKDKLKASSKKLMKEFEGSSIKILKGPYGPYVTDGSKNARIPKTVDPGAVTLVQAQELIDSSTSKRRKPK